MRSVEEHSWPHKRSKCLLQGCSSKCAFKKYTQWTGSWAEPEHTTILFLKDTHSPDRPLEAVHKQCHYAMTSMKFRNTQPHNPLPGANPPPHNQALSWSLTANGGFAEVTSTPLVTSTGKALFQKECIKATHGRLGTPTRLSIDLALMYWTCVQATSCDAHILPTKFCMYGFLLAMPPSTLYLFLLNTECHSKPSTTITTLVVNWAIAVLRRCFTLWDVLKMTGSELYITPTKASVVHFNTCICERDSAWLHCSLGLLDAGIEKNFKLWQLCSSPDIKVRLKSLDLLSIENRYSWYWSSRVSGI